MIMKPQHSQKVMDREAQRQQRRKRAQQEAQALRDPIPEHSSKTVLSDREDRIQSGNRILTLVLFTVITLCLLLTLMLGVGAYSKMVRHSSEQQQIRLHTALIANEIHQVDNADSLCTVEGPEGDALVFTESVDGQSLETRYYLCDGWLLQEYTVSGAAFSPGASEKVVETSVFDFKIEGSLISITTDAGTSYISMRSSQGGE